MLFEPDVKDYYHNRVGIDFNVIKNYDLSKKKLAQSELFYYQKKINSYLLKKEDFIRLNIH